MSDQPLSAELLALLSQHAPAGSTIATISSGKPNWVQGIDESGVWIETEASKAKGSGPQLVAAWMIQVAWDHLRQQGTLDNAYLLSTSGLNVKRSSAVCALLAKLPGVRVVSARPIRLAYTPPAPA